MVAEIYDLELITNLFTYTGIRYDTEVISQFVISDYRNDVDLLYNHITSDKNLLQVGFNNETFDYPILHYFIKNYRRLQHLTGYELANRLYIEAQRLINSKEYTGIQDKYKYIKQLDLFRIWHYNNPARKTSLKDLEFAMCMPNIEEMPVAHNSFCRECDIQLVLEYNLNDVVTTLKFLKTTLGLTDYSLYKGKNKIALRAQLSSKFNIKCLNLPDVRIGETLMLNLYAKSTNQSMYDIKSLRTPRDEIVLEECIPTWCNLRTNEFKKFLNVLENTIITNDKFEHSVIYHGIKFDFGLGGTHGCIKPGIYTSDSENIIYDLDVASLYPSIANSLKIFPKHLGINFIELYSNFIKERIAEKKKPSNLRDYVLIEGYKLILNGVYGKSGEETSFMYDRLYTYKTTIAGQLFISMWAERLVQACSELTFLQINTDGITIKCPRNKIADIDEVSNQLFIETGLEIETASYKQMIIRDVNNYLAEYDDSTSEKEHIKYKGCFEIDKEYHKDNSMRIVPLAIKRLLIDNIPLEETIRNHDNIYDFCMRLKVNSSSKAYYNFINSENCIEKKLLSRTTRYFISNTGGSLEIYYNNSISANRINKNFMCTLFNSYYQSDDYNINYNYYLAECNKILINIINNQLTLF